MNALNQLMMRPRTKPQTPSVVVNLDAILHEPVATLEQAVATAVVMLDANLFMLVNSTGMTLWATA